MVNHMNVDPELRKNVATTYYEAGHMFYLDTDCLATFKADAAQFIHASV